MPSYTEKLNLILPNENENYDVQVANTNNKLIDNEMSNKVDKEIGKVLSTNDFTNEYKKKIDAIQILYRFKGNVETLNELNLKTNNNIGDVWNCKEDNNNYCWNKEEWVNIGQNLDYSEILERIDNVEKENISSKKIQGEQIIIQDSCNCNAHLKVLGKTIQEEGTISPTSSKAIQNIIGNINFIKENEDSSMSETIVFPLSEGQVLHEGDYLDEDGIHQNRKTLVLDGTENWQNSTNRNNTFQINLSSRSMKGISSHYNSFTSASELSIMNGIYLLNTTVCLITDLKYSTVEQYKSYLAEQYANGTPAIIEYELAEETITPYTTEQQNAYNKLRLMNEDYNKITCTNEIKPNLECTYYYNNDLNNAYAKRLDKIEEDLKKIDEIEVTKLLKNNWIQHAKCQIFKENNIVHIILCVKEGTSNIIMTLPQEFRPNETIYFPCNTQEATTANYCSITNSGNLTCANGLTGKLLFINIAFKV